jgi:hypothetical protein
LNIFLILFSISTNRDEPVDDDPSFAPDGFGIGTGIAEIRAERNGQGNGRTYSITFEANDGRN